MRDMKWKKKLGKAVLLLCILYISLGIALFFAQDLLLFHPVSLPPQYKFSFQQPFKEVNISIEDRNVNLLQFSTSTKRKGIVLFFHGNMKNVEHYAKYPSYFTENGWDVWMIDYPGFGKTTGKRTEQIMYNDALLMYGMAEKQIDPDNLIIYGKSIGTGIASYLASIKNSKRLILETPYYSIDALARHYFPIYPVMPMTKYAFPIHSYLKAIKVPVTIFHGTKDEVVPYAQALQLKNEQKKTELITILGGTHNDLSTFPLYQNKLDTLLDH